MGFVIFFGIVGIVTTGILVVEIIDLIFSDSKSTRLLKVIMVPVGCFFYIRTCASAFGYTTHEFSAESVRNGFIVLIAPTAIFIIILIARYVFGKR
ncbi:hypothetical protein GCM10023310_53470 [Paenibacillus vulneris]|uniref:Uncharacterized protein n=1 Tax=Paenibacillus vulneris TaxID=1133364 RepID=A0ABW3URJ0_9BACL